MVTDPTSGLYPKQIPKTKKREHREILTPVLPLMRMLFALTVFL